MGPRRQESGRVETSPSVDDSCEGREPFTVPSEVVVYIEVFDLRVKNL